jgi:hypothetical protein
MSLHNDSQDKEASESNPVVKVEPVHNDLAVDRRPEAAEPADETPEEATPASTDLNMSNFFGPRRR